MTTITIDAALAARWLAEASAEDEYRELTADDLAALGIAFNRYCDDCQRSFETRDPDARRCPDCAATDWWESVELPELFESVHEMARKHTHFA